MHRDRELGFGSGHQWLGSADRSKHRLCVHDGLLDLHRRRRDGPPRRPVTALRAPPAHRLPASLQHPHRMPRGDPQVNPHQAPPAPAACHSVPSAPLRASSGSPAPAARAPYMNRRYRLERAVSALSGVRITGRHDPAGCDMNRVECFQPKYRQALAGRLSRLDRRSGLAVVYPIQPRRWAAAPAARPGWPRPLRRHHDDLDRCRQAARIPGCRWALR